MKRAPISIDQDNEQTPYFISVGDLMGALLLVFILMLSVTLLRLQNEQDDNAKTADAYKRVSESYEQLAGTYRQLQSDLYVRLDDEFRDDLEKWGTTIDRETLSIRFQEPEVLFQKGQDKVSDRFAAILDDFFPRYLGILMSDSYRDAVEEIRIEGHTSTEWESDPNSDTAYFRNMQLSQDRTRNVLTHCFERIADPAAREWVRSRITANGLSSAKTLVKDGAEDKEASRRVEFRVRTNAEERIAEIMRLARGSASEAALPDQP